MIHTEKRSCCRECANRASRLWRLKNPVKAKEIMRRSRQKRRFKIAAYQKTRQTQYKAWRIEYRKKNRERIAAVTAAYALSHREQLRNNEAKRLARDPLASLRTKIRRRIAIAFIKGGWVKKNSTAALLGADFETAKKWIESMFRAGMCWENHGEWHIDHKIPLCSAKSEAELIPLFNYQNLQPLWAADNLKKGASMPSAL